MEGLINRPRYAAVYGSLRKGFSNHYLLQESRLLHTMRVPGFTMYDLGAFPAVTEGKGSITVEVYEITRETFKRLDRLEGYPNFYTRRKIHIKVGLKAWIYFVNPDSQFLSHPRIVESGDWKKYREHGRVSMCKLIGFVLVLCLLATGCEMTEAQSKAMIGAIGGLAVGGLAKGKTGAIVGTLAGAAIGGLVGKQQQNRQQDQYSYRNQEPEPTYGYGVREPVCKDPTPYEMQREIERLRRENEELKQKKEARSVYM